VSRVLNGHVSVRAATRVRVEAAVQQLGYRPSALARGLVNGRSHTLGFAVYALHNPTLGLLAHGVASAAHLRGYDVIIVDSFGDADSRGERIAKLVERRVDGLLLAPTRLEEELSTIRRTGIKTVVFDTAPEGYTDDDDPLVSFVGTDNARGGHVATHHLLELGHRRIGFLGYPHTIQGSKDRLQGYRRAHDEHGIQVDPALVVEDLHDMEAARAATCQLMENGRPPTAIFAVNDELAIAALQALTWRGSHVPDDVALVGFDDTPLAAWLTVPLTTIAMPIAEIGRIATNLLIDQIEHPAAPAQRVVVPSRLIVRESCGASKKVAQPDKVGSMPVMTTRCCDGYRGHPGDK